MRSFEYIPVSMMHKSARYLARINHVAPDTVLNIVHTAARVSYEMLVDGLDPANDDNLEAAQC